MNAGRLAIIKHSLPWWREEFAIGYRAFRADNIYGETHWLAAQIWKEWHGSGVYGPAETDLASLTMAESAANAQEELAHFEGLQVLGLAMDVPPGDYAPGMAARELVTTRNRLWDNELLRHAVRMSEGGGLGLLHGAIAGIESVGSGRAQDDQSKACFAAIIVDEAGHLGSAIAGYLATERDGSEEAAVLAALSTCLSLKVAERREQFAAQLDCVAEDVPLGEAYNIALSDYEHRIVTLLGEVPLLTAP